MKKKFPIVFLAVHLFLFCSPICIPKEKVKSERVKYELPAINDSSEIVSHIAYTLSYREQFEQAERVAYLLTKEMITAENERENNFREDPLVATGSAKPADYAKSGYDKGHLAPAADMGSTKETMSESFFMSNMSPQKPGFNRGIWKKLEEKVRDFAKENDSIYIATGPVLREDSVDIHGTARAFQFKRIGKNKIVVPEYYYKVIAVYKSNGNRKGIGFILPNRSSKEKLEKFAVTIDSVETLTGLNFFSQIPLKAQETLESHFNIKDWVIENKID